MHVIQHVPRRIRRRMNLPSERMVVNGNGLGSGERYAYATGLGEVDGLFNIGKMFNRMFTFKKHSFDFKNILGAAGSVTGTIGTGGIGTVLAPKAFGAHGKVAGFIGGSLVPGAGLLPQKWTGMTASQRLGSDVALAVGAAVVGGVALAPMLPSLATMGSGLMSFGSGAMELFSGAGSGIMSMFGGGGGGQQQQQGGMTQAEYDAQQQAAYTQGQQQAAYNAQVRAQQEQMYQPNAAYGTGIPISYVPETGQPSMTGMNASYGDLRSPYTGVTQDGEQIQIDPRTGQVIQAGMIPDLSMTTWLAIGGVTLVGWYLMSGSKSESNN